MRSFSQELIARYYSKCVISLLIVAWLCCIVSDTLAGTEFGDIIVTPELEPAGNAAHGYAEYQDCRIEPVTRYSPSSNIDFTEKDFSCYQESH